MSVTRDLVLHVYIFAVEIESVSTLGAVLLGAIYVAQTLTWHKTEDRMSIVIRLPLAKFVHFRPPNK